MSHFTVLVIGENPEDQLAPFHEFECTGIDDQYIQNIDQTEEVISEYEKGKEEYSDISVFVKEYYGKESVYDERDIDLKEKHKYGYAIIKDEDGTKTLTKCIDRTNPNKQWDWYVLGGRWTGFFKAKEAVSEFASLGKKSFSGRSASTGRIDQALKEDIDFEGMRQAARKRAEEEYDFAMSIIKETPVHEPWKSIWERLNHSDQARALYHSQPRVIAWKENKEVSDRLGWSSSADDFLISRDEYVSNAVNGSACTFAVIKDGKWYERGNMGWWGMVFGEKGDWSEEFSKLIDSVSDETLLSVYDCHI